MALGMNTRGTTGALPTAIPPAPPPPPTPPAPPTGGGGSGGGGDGAAVVHGVHAVEEGGSVGVVGGPVGVGLQHALHGGVVTGLGQQLQSHRCLPLPLGPANTHGMEQSGCLRESSCLPDRCTVSGCMVWH